MHDQQYEQDTWIAFLILQKHSLAYMLIRSSLVLSREFFHTRLNATGWSLVVHVNTAYFQSDTVRLFLLPPSMWPICIKWVFLLNSSMISSGNALPGQTKNTRELRGRTSSNISSTSHIRVLGCITHCTWYGSVDKRQQRTLIPWTTLVFLLAWFFHEKNWLNLSFSQSELLNLCVSRQ
jgi:hypothetical protein